MKKYGVRGKVLELFTSYLAERKQFVEIDNVQSIIKLIEFGVPQGSILGPILFLIYINDLPEATNFFIKLYADDTYLCAKNDDICLLESQVNSELDKVFRWLASNKLTLNFDKSKFMITSKKKCATTNFKVKINEIELKRCDSYKYLGVYFDKDLNWKEHIDYVCKKVSKACGILYRLRSCLETETLREVYHALFHSYTRYGLIAWGATADTVMKPLNVLQDRAIRTMCFAPSDRTDTAPLFEILEILTVKQTYQLEVGKFVFKDKNGLLPVSMANHFQLLRSSHHSQNMRARPSDNSTIVHRTQLGEKSIQKRGIEFWNDIPQYLKDIDSPQFFKKSLKTHLIALGF